MEWLTTVSAIILLLILRIALPIAVTLLIIFLFKKLDEGWKREADLEGTQIVKAGNIGCWEINQCPAEKRALCKAYTDPDKPCWQVLRDQNGRLQEDCIGCDVFRRSPVPVAA